MKDLIKQYENAKKNALQFMKKGQINAYFSALNEMEYYKNVIKAVQFN